VGAQAPQHKRYSQPAKVLHVKGIRRPLRSARRGQSVFAMP
jgi:hypothetical protein